MADLMGLWPVPATAKSETVFTTASGTLSFPSWSGGVESVTSGGTGSFPTRYCHHVRIYARTADVWLRYGNASSAIIVDPGTASGSFDDYIPGGGFIILSRANGYTHYKTIGSAAGALVLVPHDFYPDPIN